MTCSIPWLFYDSVTDILYISQSGIYSFNPKLFQKPWLQYGSFCPMICITVAPWKDKHSISDPAVPFQHHPVLVHRDRAKGIVIRWSLNHPLQCQVVHSRVFILMVSTVMVVSCHETHHTAVGPYDGQDLIVVPGKADGVCGVRVYREVTWGRRKTCLVSGVAAPDLTIWE